jgi:hypothetical protein
MKLIHTTLVAACLSFVAAGAMADDMKPKTDDKMTAAQKCKASMETSPGTKDAAAMKKEKACADMSDAKDVKNMNKGGAKDPDVVKEEPQSMKK